MVIFETNDEGLKEQQKRERAGGEQELARQDRKAKVKKDAEHELREDSL